MRTRRAAIRHRVPVRIPPPMVRRANLERTPQLSLRQVDPLIRELVHYRDLINQKTQEPLL